MTLNEQPENSAIAHIPVQCFSKHYWVYLRTDRLLYVPVIQLYVYIC